MPRPTRLVLALAGIVVALLATLGIAACGGGGDDSAGSILKDTFSGSKSVKSGDLDVVINFSGRGGQAASQGPVGLKLSGPFQTQMVAYELGIHGIQVGWKITPPPVRIVVWTSSR